MQKKIIPPLDYLEFYKNYNLDYWPSKLSLLQNCYENLDKIKNYLYIELDDPNDDKFLLMLKTDLHFLYYQMVETLFELIFALQYQDDKNLWYYLSFADKNNYSKIKSIISDKNKIFDDRVKLLNPNDKTTISISFLRYLFFHLLDLEKIGIQEENNVKVIKELLRIFASDFSDRNEYNAFKHALRMTYEKPSPMFKTLDGKKSISFDGENAFIYLEKFEKGNKFGLSQVTKCFFPKLDILLCKYCSWLINNIIVVRKNYYFKTNEPLLTYDKIDLKEIYSIPENLGRMVLTISTEK